jgi:hypothetical protein
LTGLDAISAANGWSIAAVGVSIVFTGLTVLALMISQLHKVLTFWENRDQFYAAFRKQRGAKPAAEETLIFVPGNIQESARNYRMLAGRMKEPFALPRLLEDAVRCGISHPHSTLNELILSQIIVPDGEGYYRWNRNAGI